MEENPTLIESLLEKATEYGKASYELVKLKTLDKTSDVVSSFIPSAIVFVFIVSFLVFLNIGLAIWLGEIMGKIYFGFFVVAAFYGVIACIIHFFMHKWIKNKIGNLIIKRILK